MEKDLSVNGFSREVFALIKEYYPNVIDNNTKETSTIEFEDLDNFEIEFDNVHKFFKLTFVYTKNGKEFNNSTQISEF